MTKVEEAIPTDQQVLYSVIDQAWGQDGWILPKFFFCVFMDRDEVEVHKNAKKNEANIQPSWPNKDLLYGQKVTPSISFNAPANVYPRDFQNQQ